MFWERCVPSGNTGIPPLAKAEMRLHGRGPDVAEAAARLREAADKPHGPCGAFIIDGDGFGWAPGVPIEQPGARCVPPDRLLPLQPVGPDQIVIVERPPGLLMPGAVETSSGLALRVRS